MIQKIFTLILIACSVATLSAAEGDTIVVRSHDHTHMKFPDPDNNRRYYERVNFPAATKTFRKILLAYELECPNSGCSSWDYDTHVNIIDSTGKLDSNLMMSPFFEVDGNALDSFYISIPPTYMTYFDTANKRTDSTMSDSLLVEEYRDPNNPTNVTNTFYSFETGYWKFYHDTLGTAIDSTYVMGDSLWYQGYNLWYNVFEVVNTIEIARLITPYGEYSEGDHYPYTTYFDITDYAPLLVDQQDIMLRFSGWQDGFLGTLDFIFIEGTPPRDAKRILHKYNGSFKYGSASNPINPRLEAYDLSLNSDESYAQLNYTVTGHGADGTNCSEFCRKFYQVKVDGSMKYQKNVWKDDCGKNPIINQNGTWIYNRANWCPGLPGYTDRHDLTPHLTNGDGEVKVDFQSYVNNGNASYNISANIITFGAANHALDASVERIISPNDDWLEYQSNPLCGEPQVVIKNTGSTTLTSLKITYGPEGGTMSEYNWTGNLEFLKQTTLSLPQPKWGRTADRFIVEVSEPNGGTDEYASNDRLTSSFVPPKTFPEEFRIFFYTNNVSSQQNDIYIRKVDGTEVYANRSPQNNFKYEDTLRLEKGCYILKLTDSGNDGLRWNYNPGQGNGSLSFRDISSIVPLHLFEGDFGSEINFQFTVGDPLGTTELDSKKLDYLIYPNPTNNTLYVDGMGRTETPQIELFDQSGRKTSPIAVNHGAGKWRLDVSHLAPGLYTMRIISADEIYTEKVLIQ